MRTEIATIEEIKDEFERGYEIANDILSNIKASGKTTDFYIRQRDWCLEYKKRYSEIHNELLKESLEKRIIRALGNEERPQAIERIIKALEKHRDNIFKRKVEAALQKKEDTEVIMSSFKKSYECLN